MKIEQSSGQSPQSQQALPQNALDLRAAIIDSLKVQGYTISQRRLEPPPLADKEAIRSLHKVAVEHQIARARATLGPKEESLLRFIADGSDVEPKAIQPVLVEVVRDSIEELLFRYACLHWSIPISSGYGRRLRFLVFDEHNGKLIGVIGLCDPIYSLHSRDGWIGWNSDRKRLALKNVMDGFVLGAVPPYSALLCGKLMALLATSDEVRSAFQRKYATREALISQSGGSATLALLTTTSALGRSSLYNRLNINAEPACIRVGYTRGSGDIHFANGLYASLAAFAREHCTPSAKHPRWGSGFRNRREVIKKSLAALGLSTEWIYHGVRREVFVFPLGPNCREFLSGSVPCLIPWQRPTETIFSYFRERWLLPRSARTTEYQAWRRENWRLW